ADRGVTGRRDSTVRLRARLTTFLGAQGPPLRHGRHRQILEHNSPGQQKGRPGWYRVGPERCGPSKTRLPADWQLNSEVEPHHDLHDTGDALTVEPGHLVGGDV